MSIQLSKSQLDQLKAVLAPLGLSVTKAKVRHVNGDRLAKIRAWKPETPAGARCKSRMLAYAKLGPTVGVTSYQVRDRFGDWISPDHPSFDNAVAYRKAQDAKDLKAAMGKKRIYRKIRP